MANFFLHAMTMLGWRELHDMQTGVPWPTDEIKKAIVRLKVVDGDGSWDMDSEFVERN